MNSLNKKNINLLVCDQISFDTMNELQSYGTLLVLDQKSLKVIGYSENAYDTLKVSESDLLKYPISKFIKSRNEENLKNWFKRNNKKYEHVSWMGSSTLNIFIYIHQKTNYILLEIEIIDDFYYDNLFFSATSDLINLNIDLPTNSVEIYSNLLCKEVSKITGYDRVILYKFEKDNTGVVLGEAIKNGMEPYLGLHFPATDIPHYVREMYLSQPLRYIPTTDYTGISLKPVMIDLTDVMLRGVSPVHIQYLKNMGASSALSVAIINHNKLWGLISCQHKSEKQLSVYYRVGLLFLAKEIGRQFEMIENNVINESKDIILQGLENLHNTIIKCNNIIEVFSAIKKNILKIFSADGVALFFYNKLYTIGKTPDKNEIKNIIPWLFDLHSHEIFHSNEMSIELPLIKSFHKKIPGMLTIPITPDEKNFLIFFRNEYITTVSWAGDPNTPMINTGDTYSPRNSFELWKEIIANKSKKWEPYELTAAKSLQAIFANKQFEILLVNQAMHDPLTGLYNRRTMMEKLHHEISRAKRNKTQLSVFILDIDFFKKINDEFGHEVGDIVLVKISRFLKNIIRDYDYAYRYGGEEFLFIFSEITSDFVIQKAEQILQGIQEMKIKFANRTLPQVTVSIGVSVYPKDSEDENILISYADKALYEAKAQGRNRAVLYHPIGESFTNAE